MSREKIGTQRKASLIATLSTTNQTWNDLENNEQSFTEFLLLSEFTVSENNFGQNGINNVIYHEMFIFIGCSIMFIFEKGACRWEQCQTASDA
jgi:hypothetical protein